VHDYDAERHYRDARVNRIFEGTNEINRLLIPGMLVKRALKGDLPLVAAARALRDEIMGPPAPGDAQGLGGPLDAEGRAVEAFRKTVLLVAGTAMERYGQKLQDEQEILLWLADLVIETYASGCAVERALAAARRAHPSASRQEEAARVYVQGAAFRIDAAAREALAAMASGDVLRTGLAALRRVLKVTPADTVTLRRSLADATVSAGAYVFG
jgi:alkylation response protein AidB-like acyl-CoA dehydrogenase